MGWGCCATSELCCYASCRGHSAIVSGRAFHALLGRLHGIIAAATHPSQTRAHLTHSYTHSRTCMHPPHKPTYPPTLLCHHHNSMPRLAGMAAGARPSARRPPAWRCCTRATTASAIGSARCAPPSPPPHHHHHCLTCHGTPVSCSRLAGCQGYTHITAQVPLFVFPCRPSPTASPRRGWPLRWWTCCPWTRR